MPPADPHQSTPTPQILKQPIPTSSQEKTLVPSPRLPSQEHTPGSPWPVPVRRLASSKPKTNTGSPATRAPAGSSFLGLREADARLEGFPWGAYNALSSRRPGWGTPAWSTPSPSNSGFPSPSKSSFGLSFGPATLLPSFSQPNDAGADSVNQETVTQPSNTGVLAVNGKFLS